MPNIRARACSRLTRSRTFWHGLDREDLPCDRRTRLALKFKLVTMLRSGELLPAHRDELLDLDGGTPCIRVPAKRVKKRRIIEQPLSGLAVEIIREAMTAEDQQFVFESPVYQGQPLYRTAMGVALRGTTYTDGKRKGQTKTPGICALLGLNPFTPHDLRRTCRTLMSSLGVETEIAELAIGHQRVGLERLYNFDQAWQLRCEAFAKVSAHVAALLALPARKARSSGADLLT